MTVEQLQSILPWKGSRDCYTAICETLTSTPAETLLLSRQSFHRPSRTTNSAKGDRRGSHPSTVTTKDVMPHTKEKKQNEETTISLFVNNNYSKFAVALTSFKNIVSRKQVNNLKLSS